MGVCPSHNIGLGRIYISCGRAPYRPEKLVVRFHYSEVVWLKTRFLLGRRCALPKIYNSLENPSLQFALLHRVPREYCERVVKGKRFKQDSLTDIAGDGRFGFQSRRRKREVASMVKTVDGTGLKNARKTATRQRKETCKLVNTFQIYWAGLDPEEKKRRQDEQRKQIRLRNLALRRANYGTRKAAKGWGEGIVFASNPTKGRRGGLTRTLPA